MKTIFITGGSSRIGQSVLQALKSRYKIILLLNKTPVGPGIDNILLLSGGLKEAQRHEEIITKANIVLHFAAVTHTNNDEVYFKTNVQGTCELLSVCNTNQHFIFISTRAVGEEGGAYSYSKFLAEQAVKESGIPFTIIRPSEVYGSKTNEGIDRMIQWAKKYRLLFDFRWESETTYSPISLKELKSFIINVVSRNEPKNKTYTLCNNAPYKVREIKVALEQRLGKRLFILPISVKMLSRFQKMGPLLPFKRDQLARLTMKKSNDNSLAQSDFKFSPVSFLKFLSDT